MESGRVEILYILWDMRHDASHGRTTGPPPTQVGERTTMGGFFIDVRTREIHVES